jgi:hypothetical protein
MALTPANFAVVALPGGAALPTSAYSVSFDAVTNVASVSFTGNALPDGNYRLTLAPGTATDLAGNVLAAGASLDFFVLAGDANRDRAVNIQDFSLLAGNFNQPGTFGAGDFNYDGTVNIQDFGILAGKFNVTLPAAREAAASSMSLAAAAAAPKFSAHPIAGDAAGVDIDELLNHGQPV